MQSKWSLYFGTGRGWSAVRGAVYIRRISCGGRPSAGSVELCDGWLSPNVRVHGEDQWQEANLFGPAVLPVQRCPGPASRVLPQFPPHKRTGSGRRPLPRAFRRVCHPTAGHLASAPELEALHRTSRPRVSGRPPCRMGGTPYQVDP